MLLSGINPRHLLLGITIFTLASSVQAAAEKSEKPEVKSEVISKNVESSIPVSVLQNGTRLFANDPKEDGFYILAEKDPDPIKKGPVFVNSAPLRAGIGTNKALGVTSEDDDNDPIVAAANQSEVNEPVAQASEENQQRFFVNASESVGDQFFEAAATPVAMHPIPTKQEETQEEAKDASNFSKVKSILHTMTRKIADKKTHSKVHMASRIKQGKKVKLARQQTVKSKKPLRAVAHNHPRKRAQHTPELEVIKIKYVG